MRRWAIATVGVLAALITLLILVRGSGIAAVGQHPGRIETSIASAAWRFFVPTRVRVAANPVLPTGEVLTEARDHWADHCALCHDNNGSGQTSIGRRLYPPVPDLRSAGLQGLTDGELFYAIEEGVPWTAMPGWKTGTADGERQSWALVRFIRHLPTITGDEVKAMEAINPRTPISAESQRETDEFLKGPSPVGSGRGGGS